MVKVEFSDKRYGSKNIPKVKDKEYNLLILTQVGFNDVSSVYTPCNLWFWAIPQKMLYTLPNYEMAPRLSDG